MMYTHVPGCLKGLPKWPAEVLITFKNQKKFPFSRRQKAAG